MDVRISLYGCDDETHIDTDVTVDEYCFFTKTKMAFKRKFRLSLSANFRC